MKNKRNDYLDDYIEMEETLGDDYEGYEDPNPPTASPTPPRSSSRATLRLTRQDTTTCLRPSSKALLSS